MKEKERMLHSVIDAGISAGHYDTHELRLEGERGNQDLMLGPVRRDKDTAIGDMCDWILATLNSPRRESMSDISG